MWPEPNLDENWVPVAKFKLLQQTLATCMIFFPILNDLLNATVRIAKNQGGWYKKSLFEVFITNTLCVRFIFSEWILRLVFDF